MHHFDGSKRYLPSSSKRSDWSNISMEVPEWLRPVRGEQQADIRGASVDGTLEVPQYDLGTFKLHLKRGGVERKTEA
jgi:hypothetical protein